MRLLHTFLISILAFSSIAQEREGTRERTSEQEVEESSDYQSVSPL